MDVEQTIERRRRILNLERRVSEQASALWVFGVVGTVGLIPGLIVWWAFGSAWPLLLWIAIFSGLIVRGSMDLKERKAKLRQVKGKYLGWERIERLEAANGYYDPIARFPWEDEPLGEELWTTNSFSQN